MRATNVEQLLEALYGAAVNPERWEEALQRTVDLVGGCAGTHMDFIDDDGPQYAVKGAVGWDLAGAMADPTFPEWAQIDPWSPARFNDPEDVVVQATKHVPAETYLASAFHNEYIGLYGADWRDLLGFGPRLRDGARSIFSVYRWSKHDDFTASELELMNQLRPHMLTAFKTESRFGRLLKLTESLEASLEARDDAVIVLDRRSRIAFCNRRANRLFEGPDPVLRVRNGVLHLHEPELDRRFHKLIAASLSSRAAIEDCLRAGGAMAWTDSVSEQRYALCVTPNLQVIAPDHQPGLRSDPIAVISISDFRPRADRIAARVQAAFGLTTAERNLLARLLTGATLAGVCEETGVSMNTVRSQLKAIFRKTDTGSQAELIRIALIGF
jgi:DNA-binding CsgD family transcriptional regulator